MEISLHWKPAELRTSSDLSAPGWAARGTQVPGGRVVALLSCHLSRQPPFYNVLGWDECARQVSVPASGPWRSL